MSAVTIQDMLGMFGITALRNIETGEWFCCLADGRVVVTTQEKMEKLAVAFADWLFDEPKVQSEKVLAALSSQETAPKEKE